MHAVIDKRKEGDKAWVTTTVIENTISTHCLEFYLYMYGESPGTFDTYIKLDEQMPMMPIFNKTGTLGGNWVIQSIQFDYDVSQPTLQVILKYLFY